jgi:hypothetical protein
MSLDRFIFCPCKHPLEAHDDRGCARCACGSRQREVIDRLLDFEREAIHRAWLGATPESAPEAPRLASAPRG